MSDSTETIAVSKDDLLELISTLLAAGEVAEFFNRNEHPSPGSESLFDVAWRSRQKYFEEGLVDDDDDEAYDRHPPIVETEARAGEVAADILETMLTDEDEHAGLATLFSRDEWTGAESYPIPLHVLRQKMRARVKDSRASAKSQREHGTISPRSVKVDA